MYVSVDGGMDGLPVGESGPQSPPAAHHCPQEDSQLSRKSCSIALLRTHSNWK